MEIGRKHYTNTINELLDKLESQLGRVGQGMTVNPSQLLFDLDEVHDRIEKLRNEGNDIRVEFSQFEFITKSIRKNKRAFLRSLGGAIQLAELRQANHPPVDNFWWYIDIEITDDKKKLTKKVVIYSGIALAVVLILGVIYKLFLSPTPEELAKMDAMNDVQYLVETQDFPGALSKVEKALEFSPQDVDLLILKAVLLEKSGSQSQAEVEFATVKALIGDDQKFLLSRAMTYMQIGEAEKSQNDSQQVITMNPESAEAYYFLGRAREALGEYQLAIDAYNTGAELATKQDNAQLAATIKVNLAMLMQSIPVDFPTPVEENGQ